MLTILNSCGKPINRTGAEQEYYPEMVETTASVLEVRKVKWFQRTSRYNLEIKVNCQEYNLEETFNFYNFGIFCEPELWNIEVIDIVKCLIYIERNTINGEITRKYIDSIEKIEINR